jgi:hypothetical protein
MFTGPFRVPMPKRAMGTMGTKRADFVPMKMAMGTKMHAMGTLHLLKTQLVVGLVPTVPTVPTENE